MHILSIPLAAALLTAPAAAQQPAPKPQSGVVKNCKPTAGIAEYRGQGAAARKLGDMPPASQIYTVYNVVGGCPQPILVRKGIGNAPRQATPVLHVPPRATRAN